MSRAVAKGQIRWLRGSLLGLGAIVVSACALMAVFVGGPRDWYGFLRYAAPRMGSGDLKLGDEAPDVTLTGLDGASFRLRERVGARPIVLVFGSYT